MSPFLALYPELDLSEPVTSVAAPSPFATSGPTTIGEFDFDPEIFFRAGDGRSAHRPGGSHALEGSRVGASAPVQETITIADLAKAYSLFFGDPIEGGIGNPFTGDPRLIAEAVRKGWGRTERPANATNKRIKGVRRETTVAEVIKVNPK